MHNKNHYQPTGQKCAALLWNVFSIERVLYPLSKCAALLAHRTMHIQGNVSWRENVQMYCELDGKFLIKLSLSHTDSEISNSCDASVCVPHRMCSLWNIFSTECVLYRIYASQVPGMLVWRLACNVLSIECVLYGMCCLQNVFSIQRVLYRMCSLWNVCSL